MNRIHLPRARRPLPALIPVTLAFVLALATAGCSGDPAGPGDPDPDPDPDLDLVLVEVVSGLQDPVHLTAPTGDDRLFVVEQAGRIRLVVNGQLLADPFLDIRDQVSSGGERGLLSMAFDPEYASNGYFYLNYTSVSGATRVVRHRAAGAPNEAVTADPGVADIILQVSQPFGNHNGGHIVFGPDGMLYVAMGDGGSGGDPQGHGQDLGTLLGALLRIDVTGADGYTIPAGNPFVADPDARDEIWAYGLRNPWRIAFDEPSGMLYIADVGQGRVEEVNAEPADASGLNYGWNIMEGDECFQSDSCDPSGLVLPVHTYRTGPGGCAVIGGHVYRGDEIPEIRGLYFYTDWCQGWLRSFRLEDGEAVDHREWGVANPGRIRSMGEDARGELYMLSNDGIVYRIVPEP